MGRASRLPIIGWREWLALPDLGVTVIKAKVDTGARSSALHAFHVELVRSGGRHMVRFQVHPRQRSTKPTVSCEAEVIDFRPIRTSSGHVSRRPVIVTHVELLGQTFPIELTLASRDTMGFRMLLGRQAVRDRFLIDPGRSFLAGNQQRKPR